MKLSSLQIEGFKIRRNGDFEHLSNYSGNSKDRLVAVESRAQLDIALSKPSLTCCITTPELSELVRQSIGLLESNHPLNCIMNIHAWLVQNLKTYYKPFENDIHPSAQIDPTAVIAPKSVKIGKHCRVGPRAYIGEMSYIGDYSTIGPGCSIGYDLKTYPESKNDLRAISAGCILIGKEVDVHANCTIQKPLFNESTSLGDYVKCDNLVCIGPGAQIENCTQIVAGANIGENVLIGTDSWIGPSATIKDGIVIGKSAFISIGSVVVENVPANGRVTGNYAIDHEQFIKFIKKIR